jgi:ferredoxin
MYTKMLSLRFPPSAVNEPIVASLIRKFDLNCNILKATIYPRKEGMVVMELSGHKKNFQKGIRYLKSIGVKVESIGQDIRRNEERCFQCGACTAVCPTGALFVKRPSIGDLCRGQVQRRECVAAARRAMEVGLTGASRLGSWKYTRWTPF